MVLAIGDAVVEVRVGLGVVPVAAMQLVQVRVREARLGLKPVLERDRQRAAQHRLPVATGEPQGLRLRRRRPALHRRHAESDREFLSAPGRAARRCPDALAHSETRRGFRMPPRVPRWGRAVPGWRRRPRRRRGSDRRGTAATTPSTFAGACHLRRGGLRPPASFPALACRHSRYRASGRSSTAPSRARSSGPRRWPAPRRPRNAARVRTAWQLRDGMPACERDDPPAQHAPGRPGRRRPLRRERPAGHHRHSRDCAAPAVSERGVRNAGPAGPIARSPDARSRAGSAEPDGRPPVQTR